MTLSTQKPIAKLVYERLAQIPTRFGRLLYAVSSLDRTTGTYRHDGMQITHDVNEISEAFAGVHKREWHFWINMPLHQQHEDLLAFLDGRHRRQFAREWARLDPWENLAPPGTPKHERDLFASDLRAVLQAMKMP